MRFGWINWIKKVNGGVGVLYGLAIVPFVLFLLNGILLRHPALVVAALVFGFSIFISQNKRGAVAQRKAYTRYQ